MSQTFPLNPQGRPVAMIIGATTKWQSDGRNTLYSHGHPVDDSDLPLPVRWGTGGALTLKFAQEGFFVVLTTRSAANAARLAQAVKDQGGQCMVVEMEVSSQTSIEAAFSTLRRDAGEPEVVIYNSGWFEGRDLPPERELFEHMPLEIFETAYHVAARGPFLIVKQVLPAMRVRGHGSIFFSNNPSCLRGRKRRTGESLYYPRIMQRALAQALAEEYSEYGVHIANVIIDGLIDSPGTRALSIAQQKPERLMNPAKIADTFYHLHTQDRSCWTHEIQITPHVQNISF
jgi:NAD(P)-dependent dehydrogenase (short-subunit alcohol dehydrogenase family)